MLTPPEQTGDSDVRPTKPILLVLCTGNACRSQMAEGFLRHYHGDRYDVRSAGTDPQPRVHPLAVRVMGEVGIDLAAHRPKHARDFLGRLPVRHLLIVCDGASATCPRVWPGTLSRTLMPFDDPAQFTGNEADTLAEFRRVRDRIRDAMKEFTPGPYRSAILSEPTRAQSVTHPI